MISFMFELFVTHILSQAINEQLGISHPMWMM